MAVANTVRFTGASLADVLPLASIQPARALGLAPAGRVRASWEPAAFRLRIERVELP
jgi:N-acetylglucosamine-6-phosphate deacetylase